ncbi:MAG TPA: DUF3604 domain-containing protein [Lysobacter sp.]
MSSNTLRTFLSGSLALLAVTGCQRESGTDAAPPKVAATVPEEKTATVPTDPLRQAYFGELHLHTAYSLDAYIFGNTVNDPAVAYRFAQGEEVTLPNGIKKRLAKPLDFAAVTDHAEALGEYELCSNASGAQFNSPVCTGVRAGDLRPYGAIFAGLARTPAKRMTDLCGEDGKACQDAIGAPWKRTQEAAAQYNTPGKFTTFIAWEFSANAPEGKGGMMHRNVIFRGDKVPYPFSAFDGTGEDLHAYLDKNCTGDCKVLTIPHNPNFYWGRLYWGKNSDGSEWTQEGLERRERMDRLVEIMQIKGNSECQTGIGTTDEECNFEMVFPQCQPGQQGGCNNEDAFVRNGLRKGLLVDAERGVNPFKHGIIGGTDNHNGTPGDAAEATFAGHLGNADGTPEVRLGLKPNPVTAAAGASAAQDPTRRFNPGALAGVWAEANTREAIWDALQRKETFATSGTRARIRLMGGFDFPADLGGRPDWVKVGYETGVPQGGDLKAAPAGKAPTFVAWAQRDPDSAPLARLQIIKGWTDGKQTREMTYDVACSDSGKPDSKSHRCPDNGAAVNLDDCSISADKGASELVATWSDPDFKPGERAFYYARVLENPVCRWSMYDAKRVGVASPKDLPTTVKERAWSSPIWYTP